MRQAIVEITESRYGGHVTCRKTGLAAAVTECDDCQYFVRTTQRTGADGTVSRAVVCRFIGKP